MRRTFFTAAAIGTIAALTAAQAVDLKDCSAIKDAKLRMDCLEKNTLELKAALDASNLAGKNVQLTTRGRCLSYFDENKPPLTMTCDHRDLQEWVIKPY